jgi:hypothetical protein
MHCCGASDLRVKNNKSDCEAPPIAHSSKKKPYKPPTVIEYGNVARLTAGMNGTNIDPGHNTRTKRGTGGLGSSSTW